MMRKIILFLVIFFATTFSAKAVTFQTYSELYDCVDTYNNFIEYKKNLKNCFEKKNITIENDSLELIKKDYGVIDDVIELDLPKENAIKKPKRKFTEILDDLFKPADLEKIAEEESIFNKPSALSDEYKEKQFSLDNKDFKDLNNYIRKNPERIYSLTEDINILTYKNNYLSELKRQELLLNVYNTFDVAVLAAKVPPMQIQQIVLEGWGLELEWLEWLLLLLLLLLVVVVEVVEVVDLHQVQLHYLLQSHQLL